MKILQQINKDLERLSNDHAHGNAHGIPVCESGNLALESTSHLVFNERILLTPQTPQFLRELADILERYY